jgi:hypothetical protein
MLQVRQLAKHGLRCDQPDVLGSNNSSPTPAQGQAASPTLGAMLTMLRSQHQDLAKPPASRLQLNKTEALHDDDTSPAASLRQKVGSGGLPVSECVHMDHLHNTPPQSEPRKVWWGVETNEARTIKLIFALEQGQPASTARVVAMVCSLVHNHGCELYTRIARHSCFHAASVLLAWHT